MKNITKVKKKRKPERTSFDHFLQLWFNYHFLFFRCLIFRGLKLRAFNFFSNVKKGLKLSEDFDPSFVFLIALLKITPSILLKPLKVSGGSYGVPFPIDYWKKIVFGCKWVIKLLKDNYRVVTVTSIVDSLVLAIVDEGLSIEKKEEVYKTASLNRHLLKHKIFKR